MYIDYCDLLICRISSVSIEKLHCECMEFSYWKQKSIKRLFNAALMLQWDNVSCRNTDSDFFNISASLLVGESSFKAVISDPLVKNVVLFSRAVNRLLLKCGSEMSWCLLRASSAYVSAFISFVALHAWMTSHIGKEILFLLKLRSF